MNSDARSLDQLVRDWWLGSRDADRLSQILELAIGGDSQSVLPLSRALSILQANKLAPTLTPRIDQLSERLRQMISRRRQLEALGDLDSDPELLFAIFSDEDLGEVKSFDADGVRARRLDHQDSKAQSAEASITAIGWDVFKDDTSRELRLALLDLKERERYEAWGLFVDEDRKQGLALGINFALKENGTQFIESSSNEIRQQSRIASSLFNAGEDWEISVEWPGDFAGESIGLPLCIALLTARGEIPRDALLASTGRVDISGNVHAVTAISEKLEAARSSGFRTVIVPAENYSEASKVAGDMTIIPIAKAGDLLHLLRQPVSAIELDAAALARLIRASAREYYLVVSAEKSQPNGRQFTLSNSSGKVQIWVYSTGRVVAQGSKGKALEAAQRMISERVPPEPESRIPKTLELPTREFQDKSRSALEQIGGCVDPPGAHETWRLRIRRGRSTTTVALYTTGKCVVQGSAPSFDAALKALETVLSPIGGIPDTSRPSAASPPVQQPDNDAPHIGTDEAGKGDYFGPLVCAAVCVDDELRRQFGELGVRDSKLLSDRRVKELAEAIRRVADGRMAVTAINPPKFNELYSQFVKEKKNLNSLLAWGHARSIDRLLASPRVNAMKPRYVLVDQFADAHYVEERTHRAGIPIHQRPKAEDDIAVAAASILARDAFLNWLDKWSAKVSVVLPKGASPQVIDAGKKFIGRWGKNRLGDVAKLNFRTTQQVLEGEPDNATGTVAPWIADREVTRDG